MIHSMAGGNIGKEYYFNLVKVEILEGIRKGDISFYSTKLDLKAGDIVIVPFGINNNIVKAKVIRVDKNISSFSSPIPMKKIKEIIKKV